ncbi:peptidyl-prolyl cis-trans isomerase [Paenibacillus gorillae]|uniref:peptidyl-prolyl cis-trans isomerase n=1 Tax=Paenibacillus gorillae TaxID=1243662 RepID=UPI0004BA2151|nr:peptidyl-prolyl cis-trans isomerase [Paenibacillus gorillae]
MENKDPQQPRDEEQKNAATEEQPEATEEQTIQQEESDPNATAHDEVNEEIDTVEGEQAAASALAVPAIEQAPAPSSGGSKAWIAISAVLAIVLVIVLIKPPFTGSGKAVATVNGVKITQDKLYHALLPQGGASTLDGLITKELIDQAADKASVKITDEDVTGEIDSLIKQFGSAEALNSALTQNGMTMEDLREDAGMQLKIRKILEPQTKVTDDDVKKFYDENKASYATPEQVRVSHIMLGTKEEAADVLKQLKDGGDFAKLAAEKSTDTQSGPNGGDLGFISKSSGSGDEAFDKAAFALDVNELSDVIQTSAGFHIIKKTEVKAATNPTFEEKKEDVRKQLIDQKIQELSATWMEELHSKAKIENTLEKEKAPAPAAK